MYCAEEASVPIKSYSPELMVQSAYSIRELDDLLDEERTPTSELEACRRRSGGGGDGDGLDASDVESMMGKLEHSTERQDILVRSELARKDEEEMEDLASRLGRMGEGADGGGRGRAASAPRSGRRSRLPHRRVDSRRARSTGCTPCALVRGWDATPSYSRRWGGCCGGRWIAASRWCWTPTPSTC